MRRPLVAAALLAGLYPPRTGIVTQLVSGGEDNGPWLAQREQGGSAGPLYSGKGSPFEGGIRVPAIAWWPGRIPAGRTLDEPAGALDLLPTLVPLAGGRVRADRVYYGADILPLFTGQASRLSGAGQGGGREFLSFSRAEAVSLRSGRYKYLRPGYWSTVPTLFDLETDPGERHDLYAPRPVRAATRAGARAPRAARPDGGRDRAGGPAARALRRVAAGRQSRQAAPRQRRLWSSRAASGCSSSAGASRCRLSSWNGSRRMS